MEDEWRSYLKSVGFREPLLNRCRSAIQFYKEVIGMNIKTVFVSEYRVKTGMMKHESLWVFSDDLVGESSLGGPVSNDVIGLKNNISRCEVRVKDYNFDGKCNEQSRLTIEISFESFKLFGRMQASGPNCTTLDNVLRKFIVPSISRK